MSKSKEEELWQACTIGDLETVKKMADDPATTPIGMESIVVILPSIVPASMGV